MMRKFVFYTILFFGLPLMLNGQVYKEDLGGYVSFATVDKNGDTIPMYFISDIVKYPPLKSKKLEKFYWKTVRDVKKVYPYVKIVGREYARIQQLADTIPDPKEREQYMKKYEKALLKQYEPVMRKFTLSQGKMMIKLMNWIKKDTKLELMLNEPHITEEMLGGITARTLVLAGSKDLIREKETRRIAAAIPGAELHILPGEGHGSYIAHKEKIAKLIIDFAG